MLLCAIQFIFIYIVSVTVKIVSRCFTETQCLTQDKKGETRHILHYAYINYDRGQCTTTGSAIAVDRSTEAEEAQKSTQESLQIMSLHFLNEFSNLGCLVCVNPITVLGFTSSSISSCVRTTRSEGSAKPLLPDADCQRAINVSCGDDMVMTGTSQ